MSGVWASARSMWNRSFTRSGPVSPLPPPSPTKRSLLHANAPAAQDRRPLGLWARLSRTPFSIFVFLMCFIIAQLIQLSVSVSRESTFAISSYNATCGQIDYWSEAWASIAEDTAERADAQLVRITNAAIGVFLNDTVALVGASFALVDKVLKLPVDTLMCYVEEANEFTAVTVEQSLAAAQAQVDASVYIANQSLRAAEEALRASMGVVQTTVNGFNDAYNAVVGPINAFMPWIGLPTLSVALPSVDLPMVAPIVINAGPTPQLSTDGMEEGLSDALGLLSLDAVLADVAEKLDPRDYEIQRGVITNSIGRFPRAGTACDENIVSHVRALEAAVQTAIAWAIAVVAVAMGIAVAVSAWQERRAWVREQSVYADGVRDALEMSMIDVGMSPGGISRDDLLPSPPPSPSKTKMAPLPPDESFFWREFHAYADHSPSQLAMFAAVVMLVLLALVSGAARRAEEEYRTQVAPAIAAALVVPMEALEESSAEWSLAFATSANVHLGAIAVSIDLSEILSDNVFHAFTLAAVPISAISCVDVASLVSAEEWEAIPRSIHLAIPPVNDDIIAVNMTQAKAAVQRMTESVGNAFFNSIIEQIEGTMPFYYALLGFAAVVPLVALVRGLIAAYQHRKNSSRIAPEFSHVSTPDASPPKSPDSPGKMQRRNPNAVRKGLFVETEGSISISQSIESIDSTTATIQLPRPPMQRPPPLPPMQRPPAPPVPAPKPKLPK